MEFRFIGAMCTPCRICQPEIPGVALRGALRERQTDCTYGSVRRLAQLVLAAVSLAAANAAPDQPKPDQPKQEAHPYRKHWKQSIVGKAGVSGVMVKAGIGQLLGHPRNYGGGLEGFGKRLGAGFTTHVVKTTVEHAIAAPLHEDLIYHPSNMTGFRPRVLYALKSTVITHSTRSGKAHPAVGRLSGHAAAGVVSQLALHAGSGAATAGVGLAAEAGLNVAREFWPRHNSEPR